MYCSELTREQLEQMGFVNVVWDNKANNWHIERYWYKTGPRKSKELKVIAITEVVFKHKYTGDKKYPKISFSFERKGHSIPLARFIYAWFNGKAEEGCHIDHIDNDPFNNKLDNLQQLTIEENLAKRYLDNPDSNRNQWDAMWTK